MPESKHVEWVEYTILFIGVKGSEREDERKRKFAYYSIVKL